MVAYSLSRGAHSAALPRLLAHCLGQGTPIQHTGVRGLLQSESAQITSHLRITACAAHKPSFSCSSAMCFGVPTRYFTKVRTPSASIAKLERMVPSTTLPYMFFSPHAP